MHVSGFDTKNIVDDFERNINFQQLSCFYLLDDQRLKTNKTQNMFWFQLYLIKWEILYITLPLGYELFSIGS